MIDQESPRFAGGHDWRQGDQKPKEVRRKGKARDKEEEAEPKSLVDPKRRERNRELAKESRKRKKEYISSLEDKCKGLEAEVTWLNQKV